MPAGAVKHVDRVLGSKAERSAVTRAALISAARRLFAEMAYHAAGTNDLLAAAPLTRGALYHHSADKADIFEAVCHQLYDELFEVAAEAVAPLPDGDWNRVGVAFQTHLRLRAESPEAQRILLIDGPAVLGLERWRRLQAET